MTEQNKKKTRLTLNTIGLLLLVVIGAAYFYVWKAGTELRAQALDLSNNVSTTQLQIKTLAPLSGNIDSRLDKINSELTATQTGFPHTVDLNEVFSYILGVAGDAGVDILPLQSEGWTAKDIGQQYRVLVIQATAEGSLKKTENFMTALQAGQYPTLVISEFEINRKNAGVPGFPGDEMPVSVSLTINIYTVTDWLTEDSLE